MKTRLCLFGDAGNQAMKSEMGQLQADSYETKTFQGIDYRTTERSPGISYVPEAEEVWHDQGPRMC